MTGMKPDPRKAFRAARETFHSHYDYCPVCVAPTGVQCPRGAQLARRLAVATTRAGGPAKARGI